MGIVGVKASSSSSSTRDERALIVVLIGPTFRLGNLVVAILVLPVSLIFCCQCHHVMLLVQITKIHIAFWARNMSHGLSFDDII